MNKSRHSRLLAAIACAAMIFFPGCNMFQGGGADFAKLSGEIKEAQQKAAQADQAAAGALKATEEARKQALEANQKAIQALAEAAESRKAIADLNEKMNRMFNKTMMK